MWGMRVLCGVAAVLAAGVARAEITKADYPVSVKCTDDKGVVTIWEYGWVAKHLGTGGIAYPVFQNGAEQGHDLTPPGPRLAQWVVPSRTTVYLLERDSGILHERTGLNGDDRTMKCENWKPVPKM